MSESFVHREVVRWSDVDVQGVLNNAVYLTLFEQARFGYFRNLGLLDDDAFPFLLGETGVRFEQPAHAGHELQISARVVRLGNKSFDMDYTIWHREVEIAVGWATLVWVDAVGHSTPIPESARDAIAAFEGIPARDAED